MSSEQQTPSWRSTRRPERRWPAGAVVVGTVALQLLLPRKLVLHPWWLLPAVTGALVVALVLVNPRRVSMRESAERMLSLCVVGAASVTNAISAVQLVDGILTGSITNRPGPVLVSAAIVYWSNIVVFSLWYWELDRGGPAARAAGRAEHPDFLFPQMSDPSFSADDWHPRYADYLYLAFTNSTAFSPTDVMPLRPWTKIVMMIQAGISLVIALLVVAWAVGALNATN